VDLLLTDAALGVLNRVNPGGSGLRLAAALAARPQLVASRTRNLLGELTRIAAGTSQIEPSRRDRRFADPGWAGNPLLRRVLQGYLAPRRPRRAWPRTRTWTGPTPNGPVSC
jgi:polyhydroxyalkanoate synthase